MKSGGKVPTCGPLGSGGGAWPPPPPRGALIGPSQDPAARGNARGGANLGRGLTEGAGPVRPAGVCGVSWERSCLLLPARRGWSRGADAGSSHPVGGTRGSQAEPRERPHGELGHWLGRGMGPAAFPRAKRSGDPAPGLEHPNAAGQAVQRPPAEGLGPLGFGSSVDDGPGSRGTARSRGAGASSPSPQVLGSVGGSPEIGGAPGAALYL